MSKIFNLQLKINNKVLRLGNVPGGYECLEKIYKYATQLLREANEVEEE